MVGLRSEAELERAIIELFDPARYPDRSEPLRPEHAVVPAKTGERATAATEAAAE